MDTADYHRDHDERLSKVENWATAHDAVCSERYGEIVKNQEAGKQERADLRELISTKMAGIYRLIWSLILSIGASVILGLIAVIGYLADRYVMPPGH